MKDKNYRQYRSTQGRSPRQVENNYKVISMGVIGFIVTLIFLIFLS